MLNISEQITSESVMNRIRRCAELCPICESLEMYFFVIGVCPSRSVFSRATGLGQWAWQPLSRTAEKES